MLLITVKPFHLNQKSINIICLNVYTLLLFFCHAANWQGLFCGNTKKRSFK